MQEERIVAGHVISREEAAAARKGEDAECEGGSATSLRCVVSGQRMKVPLLFAFTAYPQSSSCSEVLPSCSPAICMRSTYTLAVALLLSHLRLHELTFVQRAHERR